MSIKDTVARVLRGGGDASDDAQQPPKREPAPDALTLIKNDHHEVEKLFDEALQDDAKGAKQRDAIRQILEKLTLHADMEEAIFYPALRKAGGKDEKDTVLEAFEEHDVAKELMAKIASTPPRDETLKAKVTVLKEVVQHHVKEEEGEMFGEARKALGHERLQQLGEEMQAYKDSHGAPRGRRGTASAKKSSARGAAAKKSPIRAEAAKKSPARASTAATASSSRNGTAKTAPSRGSTAKKSSGRAGAVKKTGSTRKR